MKKLIALLLAGVMIFTLAACNQKQGGGASGPDEGGDKAQQGGADSAAKDTLKIGVKADPGVLDPYFTSASLDSTVAEPIYDTLVKVDVDGSIMPQLAEKWDISDDGLEYTFTLRQDVTFHNGEKLTADDVVFSTNRGLTSPYMASTFAQYCESAEKIDDYTVKLKLKQPYGPFLTICGGQFVIHNQKAVEDAGSDEAYFDHPIGCGPYKFVEHKPADSVVLVANEDYYKGAPAIKNVIFKVIPDINTLAVAVETGEVDIVGSGLGGSVPASSLESLQQKDNLEITYLDSINTIHLTFNTTIAPFDNKLVRQAFSHAIDKQFISSAIYSGKATVATSMLTPKVFGFTDKLTGQPYDVEKAQQLLADAGYPNGQGIPVIELKTQEGNNSKACEIIQENLKAIGVTVEVQIVEQNVYFSDLDNGNYMLGILGITFGTDAALYSKLFTTPNIGALNAARYSSAQVDDLFNQAETITDQAKRQEIYDELFLLLEDECPYAPLFYDPALYVYDKNLDVGPHYAGGPRVAMMSYK